MDWLTRAFAGAHDFSKRHPRGLATGVAAGLVGFAATAFGIAPLAPDASDLPQRLLHEQVQAADVEGQLEALADHSLELYRSDATRATDTVESLLGRLGVSDAEAVAFLQRDAGARSLLAGRAGKQVQVRAREDGTLVELIARYPAGTPALASTHFTRLKIERTPAGWASRIDTAALEPQVRLASGTIRTSLFAATDEARLPDAVATQIAEMFSTDIDFHRSLQRGDTFSVVYEALTADGEPVTWQGGSGRVLAAEFINAGRVHQALWYQDETRRGAYFGFDGESKRRSFLASPLEFSRITSGFAMRMHPVLQRMRAHRGIDYAAPTGTPVRAVGEGTVDFAGWQNGYGKVVRVQHPQQRATLYAHLSRIDVRVGQRLDAGQSIGAVGATGWATGPHLHFEFLVNGEQRDPVTVAKASDAITIGPSQRVAFEANASTVLAQLSAARTLTRATGETD